MKKLSILFVFAALLPLLEANAQSTNGRCGVSLEDQKLIDQRLQANLQAGNQENACVNKYVPVFFHRVGDASGAGKVYENKILTQLCEMNEQYQSLGIQFYLAKHPTYGLWDNTINHNNVYTDQTNAFLMNNKKFANAINYYVVNTAESGNPLGITLAYYSPNYDWIVTRKDQMGVGNSTISHETGHFFSLNHTFFGWEGEPFCPTSAGWPIAPATSPGGNPTEKMDGSNCTVAGDRICDTPPDYLVAFCGTQNGCDPYTGGAKDPMGVLIDPMENNYMSYFENCQNYVFTPIQGDVMCNDLNSAARNFLDNTFVPAATSITVPANLLVAPATGAIPQFYDNITLEWTAVTGATYYFIEVDIAPNFISASRQTFVVQGTTLNLTNLVKNKKHYWKVTPFNEYYTCATGLYTYFTTSTTSGLNQIAELSDWSVIPNPASANSPVTVSINANSSFKGSLQVFDIAGKLVFEKSNERFPEGNTSVEIPTNILQRGVYLVTLTNNAATITQRLIISE